MSAHTGDSLDNGNELVALAKRWLSGLAAGIAGHEVDVSPVGHFLEFLVFGGLLYGAFAATVERSPRALVAYAAVVASAYGISDEFHQIFVPGRSCDPADWLVDTVAALVGSALVFLVMRRGALRKNDGMQDEGQGY